MAKVTQQRSRTFWATPLRIGLILSTSLAVISCGSPATAQDQAKLQEVRSAYGKLYEFELEEGLYLNANALTDKQSEKEEAIRIYKAFWFDGAKPRNTTYVYLNIFNKQGAFQFQVYWDSKKGDFGFSERPYY